MGGDPAHTPIDSSGKAEARTAKKPRTRGTKAPDGEGAVKPKRRRRSGGPGIVKDLSLRPSGKTSFVTFAKEKKPRTHAEKQAVIVYWLQHEAGMSKGITPAHINTCYQEAGWPRPTDLVANLYLTAHRKGWLDTSDIENIIVPTRGEDLVQHSLPPAAKEK